MLKHEVVNIINFIRACEPRAPMDLVTPVKEQIKLIEKHNLCGTFLMQYDALIDPQFVELMKGLDPTRFEIGVWHETVEPEVKAAGLEWTGRFPWDWHAHCGFSVGYTKEQREKICDVLFEKFKEVFGYYPRVFGSWLFDSHTVRYISDKYGLDAICNCKEQYGTDGYTLWGGYYGQGYYPSRTNCFMPAQTKEEQIPAPLFRMLGSDQVYQYDFGMDRDSGAAGVQGVITLEPVYCGNSGGGGVPKWVDWYLRENFNGECLSFGYTQAGQENSFGWDSMKNGLNYQFARFERLRDEGKITVETLGETGRRYKATYETTPASTITAHSAFNDENKKSIWYSSRFYRTNVYMDGIVRLRDLHLFSEKFPDPFEDTVCEANEATYETLPVADGNRHSGNGTVAGIYLIGEDGQDVTAEDFNFTDAGNGCTVLEFDGTTITLRENSIRIERASPFRLENRIGKKNDHVPTVISAGESEIVLEYSGIKYKITLRSGKFENTVTACSCGNVIEAEFGII